MAAYGINSRDYLERARSCLRESELKAVIYAALELRAGIEARMQAYLEVWDHVSKSVKKGRLISALGKATDRHFAVGDKIVRIKIEDRDASEVLQVFYFTPISKSLRQRGEPCSLVEGAPPRKALFGRPLFRSHPDGVP